jgi:signal transduction histidine kinase
MNRLIDDLLDIARIDAGSIAVRCAPVEVTAVLADIEETQGPIAARARIELTIAAASPAAVWADRDRLDQVLENLIGNAVKFTRAGGHVRVGSAVNAANVRFWVADTGPGISAEHLEHLFDRFWQASTTDRRGAGLGLAIAKALVEAHGGRIWVDSRVGEGTIVYFEIPRARSSHLAQSVEQPVGETA